MRRRDGPSSAEGIDRLDRPNPASASLLLAGSGPVRSVAFPAGRGKAALRLLPFGSWWFGELAWTFRIELPSHWPVPPAGLITLQPDVLRPFWPTPRAA
jgi:hypothetical protein